MAKEHNRPRIDIEGCDFSNNRGHGIAVGEGADVELNIKDTTVRDNFGSGFHQEGQVEKQKTDRRWFERPLGIVVLAVIAMGIAYFLGFT